MLPKTKISIAIDERSRLLEMPANAMQDSKGRIDTMKSLHQKKKYGVYWVKQ